MARVKLWAKGYIQERMYEMLDHTKAHEYLGANASIFPRRLVALCSKRYYMHPGHKPIIKYYGYIENATEQMVSIGLYANTEKIHRQVFYITDAPIDNAE